MSSPRNPKPTATQNSPAFTRVFRAYLRNAASPSVWAPLAVIALILALSADYWQSLTALDPDTEAALISDNVSELADSVSEASSIAASEIDSSDVLSDLLSQARLPVTDDTNAEAAEAANGRIDLEEVDLLDLPDLSGSRGRRTAAGGQGETEEASADRTSRRFGLLDLLGVSSNSVAQTQNTATDPALSDGASRFSFGAAGFMGLGASSASSTDDGGEDARSTASSSRFGSGAIGSGFATTPATVPAASTASPQFGANPSTFTGYPYSGAVSAPATNPNLAPSFTGYPPVTGSTVSPTNGYTGYTGYPSAGSMPSPSYGAGAGSPQPSGSQVGQPQYTAPSFNNAPNGSTMPNSGVTEAQGVSADGATVNSPTTPYSIPRSAPGRYIGNGEINTFANP